ncbi:MAG TPA: hypothetical protein VF928_15115 [Usitatibacteraceae bacterium]
MSAFSRITRFFYIFVGAVLLFFIAYTLFTLTWAYSEGDRAGVLQKFSKKGWLCKTWEGELLQVALPSVVPEKFEFSVRDELVAKQLLDNIGKRVVVSYEQHKGVPSSCFADTEYFVEKVQVQDQQPLPVSLQPTPPAVQPPALPSPAAPPQTPVEVRLPESTPAPNQVPVPPPTK